MKKPNGSEKSPDLSGNVSSGTVPEHKSIKNTGSRYHPV